MLNPEKLSQKSISWNCLFETDLSPLPVKSDFVTSAVLNSEKLVF